ncbi:hypothetical protein BKA61DRAFT_300448 [Leptodontidium sp. MPI-SDFR-AT-0119]|nr:hypothetical protein BKA61DRAFT_300448 [Leptodontidium sp. MPI-SDFR-AT-0119]
MILKSASTVGHDPFRITTHMEFSSKLMEESGLLTREAIHNIQAAANPGGPRLPLLLLETLDRRSEERLPGVPRHATLRDGMIKEATQRFLWGLGGGLALICPMVLMVLHKDTLTTLLTTSVSVILFSFAVASISSGLLPGTEAIDLGPRDVLAATATYAAVLVVFVGASS